MAEAEDIERCHRCLQPNVKWTVPAWLWQRIIIGDDTNNFERYGGSICMTCFVKVAPSDYLCGGWMWRLTVCTSESDLPYGLDRVVTVPMPAFEHVHFPAGWTLNLPPNVVMERFDFVKPFETSLNIEASGNTDVEPPHAIDNVDKPGVWIVFSLDMQASPCYITDDELDARRWCMNQGYGDVKFWELGTEWRNE